MATLLFTLTLLGAPLPRVLVLPVTHAPSGTEHGLAQRLCVAVAAAHKLDPVTLRDLDALLATQRAQDLVGCTHCLGAQVDAQHVIASEILDAPTPTWFVTVLDATTGASLRRRGFPWSSTNQSVVTDVAAWLTGSASPPRLRVHVRAPSDAKPAAVLLERALVASLTQFQDMRLTDSSASDATHSFLVTIDALSLRTARHHVHTYRDATLSASFVLTDAAGTRVFLSRSTTVNESQRRRYSSDEQVRAALVDSVNREWLRFLRMQGLSAALLQREDMQ